MNQMVVAILLASIITTGCGSDAAHDHHDGAGEHGHPHETDATELPGQSLTIWTDHTELFMEYRPLIVGRDVGFAAHVTAIPGFRAVTQGAVTVDVTLRDGPAVSGKADQPASPGIFRPSVHLTQPGACDLRVTVVRDGITDVIPAGPCTVFPDEKTARDALGDEAEPAGRITYLKEQQWKTDFATIAASERALQDSIEASGEIKPAAGKDARVAAPAAGRISFVTTPPILGAAVRRNDTLALFTPHLAGGDRTTLEADVQSAQAESDAATAQLARAQRLFAEQAIPRKGVEEAQARAATAQARLRAAAGRLSQYDVGLAGGTQSSRGSIELRVPIDGTLVAVEVASGESVEAGKLLFRIVDLQTVWLEARIFESDIRSVEGARSGWFLTDGSDQRIAFDSSNSHLVTLGNVIDAANRTVPLIFELQNADARLRIGQFVKAGIATGSAERALAIPESALIDEAGKSIAYVQIEGEAFERRVAKTGIRDGGWVQILDGVSVGEHVVTTGAYDIKLATASGVIPAHGHAH